MVSCSAKNDSDIQPTKRKQIANVTLVFWLFSKPFASNDPRLFLIKAIQALHPGDLGNWSQQGETPFVEEDPFLYKEKYQLNPWTVDVGQAWWLTAHEIELGANTLLLDWYCSTLFHLLIPELCSSTNCQNLPCAWNGFLWKCNASKQSTPLCHVSNMHSHPKMPSFSSLRLLISPLIKSYGKAMQLHIDCKTSKCFSLLTSRAVMSASVAILGPWKAFKRLTFGAKTAVANKNVRTSLYLVWFTWRRDLQKYTQKPSKKGPAKCWHWQVPAHPKSCTLFEESRTGSSANAPSSFSSRCHRHLAPWFVGESARSPIDSAPAWWSSILLSFVNAFCILSSVCKRRKKTVYRRQPSHVPNDPAKPKILQTKHQSITPPNSPKPPT